MTFKQRDLSDRHRETEGGRESGPVEQMRRSMARARAAGVCRAVCPAVAEELALWAD